jgi:hypothetical protein
MDSTKLLTIKLAGGATHCIDQPQGLTVRAMRGRVWLTVTGLLDDVVLDAGETFEVMCDGRMVIEPMEVGGNDGSAIFEIGEARRVLPNARDRTDSSFPRQKSETAFPHRNCPINQA